MIDALALESTELSPSGRIADSEGTMEQAPLVYALVHALDRAITGDIVFHAKGGESHTVTFFEGAPVRVVPGVEGDRIGDDLVAMDHVSEDALAAALLSAQTSRRRLGELLVAAEAVSPEALTETLTLQTARRLARLANLPPESTFSIYFSARAEPEPHAPWAPIDTLLATIRAWTDRSRLHGTLRWLAPKPLRLAPDATIEPTMLTSRELAAVAMMREGAPTLKALYAEVGNGLSSLLYMLAVTRQFTFSSEKGPPMGRRKGTDLINATVQIAVPIAPVIAPLAEPVPEGEVPTKLSVPPPANVVETLAEEPAPAAVPRPAPSAPVRRRVSVPIGPDEDQPVAPPVRVAPLPAAVPRPVVAPAPVAAAAPKATPSVPSFPAPPRPSASPPKFVDPGRPPMRVEAPSAAQLAHPMSDEFRRAEDAAKRHDYTTADRILGERCTEQDATEPDFQALTAWVKANLTGENQTPLNDLTFLLMSHNQCESALYYRGMLLKRSGKEKAALRDFVVLVKKNPGHMGALSEIKLLRDAGKK